MPFTQDIAFFVIRAVLVLCGAGIAKATGRARRSLFTNQLLSIRFHFGIDVEVGRGRGIRKDTRAFDLVIILARYGADYETINKCLFGFAQTGILMQETPNPSTHAVIIAQLVYLIDGLNVKEHIAFARPQPLGINLRILQRQKTDVLFADCCRSQY